MTTIEKRARKVGLAALIAALAACLTLAAPAAAAKKKGKKKAGAVDITKAVNAPIPDATPPPAGALFPRAGTLASTIDVGKQFQGTKVRDVNVTVQTGGTGGTEPGDNLAAWLSAPNGATAILFFNLDGNATTPSISIGPLTLDDEARLGLGTDFPTDPFHLFVPWAGMATPFDPLAVMDNGAVRGTWTLTVQDVGPMETSNLVSWRLNVVAGRPFQTK